MSEIYKKFIQNSGNMPPVIPSNLFYSPLLPTQFLCKNLQILMNPLPYNLHFISFFIAPMFLFAQMNRCVYILLFPLIFALRYFPFAFLNLKSLPMSSEIIFSFFFCICTFLHNIQLLYSATQLCMEIVLVPNMLWLYTVLSNL